MEWNPNTPSGMAKIQVNYQQTYPVQSQHPVRDGKLQVSHQQTYLVQSQNPVRDGKF